MQTTVIRGPGARTPTVVTSVGARMDIPETGSHVKVRIKSLLLIATVSLDLSRARMCKELHQE